MIIIKLLLFCALFNKNGISKPVEDRAEILSQHFDINPDGSYNFAYETSDKQRRVETGELKKVDGKEVLVVKGEYSYLGPDNVPYKISYSADENGFRTVESHVAVTTNSNNGGLINPVDNSLPPAVLASLTGPG